MSDILLVPLELTALQTDGTTKLAAALADFTKLPYYYLEPPAEETTGSQESEGQPPPPPPASGSGFNGDQAFLSETVFRAPNPAYDGDDDTWTPPAGLHLHWKLPHALTTRRKDPDSGDQARFPQTPNRWMIVLSTKSGDDWEEQDAWVVESDFLYPGPMANPVPCGVDAISFPIAPPEAFNELLNTPVSPAEADATAQDMADYPFMYQAPFRCMGRKLPLLTWQADGGVNDYLPAFNPAGLTAVGYGHPLFAAVYSNCFSVFGFHDDLNTATFPRRYDLIGWYEDADSDCLSLFQNPAPGTTAWDMLKNEYNWTSGDTSGEFPSLSVYYARLEIDAALSGNLPSDSATLTVGNTATEALAARLAQSLQSDAADQAVVEEQLEAMGLSPQLGNENIDLGAKFVGARHAKGFNKIHGGSLWSVRVKSSAASAQPPSLDQNAQASLPGRLANMLNNVNVLQSAFDDSWDDINSLRKRAFADWYRLEFQRVAVPGGNPSLPSLNDILHYSRSSVLNPLQERTAFTGQISYSVDAEGRPVVSAADSVASYDLTVQYSMAQQLVQAIDALSQQLALYNSGNSAASSGLQFYLIRKGAPRFYRPTDPAVLLEGAALDRDDQAASSAALDCGTCTVNNPDNTLSENLRNHGLTSSGIFNTIRTSINARIQSSNSPGYDTQSAQPWNPVALEWSAQVWPEKRNTGTGATGEGIEYNTDFVAGTYALDVNAADLKLAAKPSALTTAEAPYDYTGRVVLLSHAPASLQNSIQNYLMPLSLFDLKQGGARGQTISNETDYQYDSNLFTWANTIFGIPLPPFAAELKDPSTLTPTEINQQQSEITAWLKQQYPFETEVNNVKVLIDLATLLTAHPDWIDSRPVILDGAALGVFSSLTTAEQAQDPVLTAVRAYTAVADTSMLSQALSGFNDALLTQEREFQLPVWNWCVMNIPDEKAYARDVAWNLDGIYTAPVFDGAFLPLRAGLMQVAGLTLVDSFGQYLALNYGGASATQKSERMTILANVAASVADPANIATEMENQEYLYLPPRFAQETRLNFRWLAADAGTVSGSGDEPEMNDHPATTPVCGWVLPNNLDGNLAIYSAAGTALGSIVQSDTGGAFALAWQSAPGTNNYTPLSNLPNPHLYNFVNNIIDWASESQTTWTDFLSGINAALQNIDPKSFAQHPALALLIGRPMALVRTSLQIQTRGYADIDQTVAAFNHDESKKLFTRLTNGFDDVIVPVRLGEANQLNDGLAAYFVEDGTGGFIAGSNGPAHFPESGQIGAAADTISLSLSGDPLKLSMLVDPRGSVHAACGFLPVKDIAIPPDQFANVLRSLSVTFLTSPLITPLQSVQYPLPAEAGYGWTWFDRPDAAAWNRVADIQNTSQAAAYQQQRILEGWLKLSPQTDKETN